MCIGMCFINPSSISSPDCVVYMERKIYEIIINDSYRSVTAAVDGSVRGYERKNRVSIRWTTKM